MSKDHILRSKQNGVNAQINQLIDDYLSPKQQKQRQIRRTLRQRKDAPRVCAIHSTLLLVLCTQAVFPYFLLSLSILNLGNYIGNLLQALYRHLLAVPKMSKWIEILPGKLTVCSPIQT